MLERVRKPGTSKEISLGPVCRTLPGDFYSLPAVSARRALCKAVLLPPQGPGFQF